jgi:hypothetical protein
MCGPSSTVVLDSRVSSPSPPPPWLFAPEFVPEPAAAAATEAGAERDDGSVLYRGTAKAKTDPCFGSTVMEFQTKRDSEGHT